MHQSKTIFCTFFGSYRLTSLLTEHIEFECESNFFRLSAWTLKIPVKPYGSVLALLGAFLIVFTFVDEVLSDIERSFIKTFSFLKLLVVSFTWTEFEEAILLSSIINLCLWSFRRIFWKFVSELKIDVFVKEEDIDLGTSSSRFCLIGGEYEWKAWASEILNIMGKSNNNKSYKKTQTHKQQEIILFGFYFFFFKKNFN